MRNPLVHSPLALSLLAGITSLAATPAAADPALLRSITGKVVAVIADGDFAASSYVDGRLAPADGRKDVLQVVGLGGPRPVIGSVEVSNSVTATPEVLALSPDGRHAYVIERLGRRTPEAERAADLAPGTMLTIIDIADPAGPRISDTAKLTVMPESVRVSPDGRFLAIPSNSQRDAVVQIVPVAGGKAGPVATFNLSDLGVERRDGPRGGITATFVDWHPSGRALAVNLNTRNEVRFLKLDAAGDGPPRLTPWGGPVAVGPDPFVGRFTPDGRHYLTSDWGRDFSATTLEGRLPTKPSTVTVVRLADLDGSGGTHAVAGRAESDRSAEGIAVSPDGRLIATVNMRETALPTGSPRHSPRASVSLLVFDPATGAITKLADTPFDGVLPEGASFDATGEHLLVTSFEYRDSPRPMGGIEVFRVIAGARPGLERLGRIETPAGTHHVEIR